MQVEVLSCFGTDEMIANVARVSYQKEASNYTEEQNNKLIKYLWSHKHTSPFRHPQVQFRVKCPIYVERQLFKHQQGVSANCLHGSTIITFVKKTTKEGLNKISIEELYEKFTFGRKHQRSEKDALFMQRNIRKAHCRVLNEATGEFTTSNIKNVTFSGVKKLFKITLQDGKELICTEDHKIYTKNGWNTIKNGITTKDFVATNGVKYVGNGDYQNKDILKATKDSGMSVSEMAEKFQCSYHTIRKWLKIHDIRFDSKETYFKQGSKPWNKGMSGYRLTYTEKGFQKKLEIAHNQKKGADSPAWRGGVTKERGKIGQWTRTVAKEVHKKYNFTCQVCGTGKGLLHCHHIIPVVVDVTKAYDINNLVTVCNKCHPKIHKSAEAEKEFAQLFYTMDEIKDKRFGIQTYNNVGNILKVGYSKIQSIELFGEDKTYDIEMEAPHHNFVANGIIVHNSISGRYVDFSDSYSKIEEWRAQSTDSKQGSAGPLSPEAQLECDFIQNSVINHCATSYARLIELGVAKEQARSILPLSLETEFIWTGSLQAFMHMCSLRLKPDTQAETREVVRKMLDELRATNYFPVALSLIDVPE